LKAWGCHSGWATEEGELLKFDESVGDNMFPDSMAMVQRGGDYA